MKPSPLDKLHDFYQPAPPAWIPQTIGWYVLFAIAGFFAAWMIIRSIHRWSSNRYRREALRELALLPVDQLSDLLKRTALAAWPRDRVASLSGGEWLTFLSETGGNSVFNQAPGNGIEEIALRPYLLSDADQQQLRAVAAEWIRRHRVQT